ncbi:hypothetical protein Clacol_002988 [Clathrus columnatus]|uniref:Uncharacterized protein n=1 Tax=Clathrus columnatus TaxID=1419009 RepID=A0AAV5A7P9_9AGAM|nr:hypothetical protein Clacol_002988 [Clathrus columnatus]
MSRQLSVLSTTARAIRLSTRRYATAVEGNYFVERKAVKEHAEPFVCIAWVRNVEAEHASHIHHIKEENGGVLPEVPEYDYMNKREKPFPWGYNTLFFNPHANKDMTPSE